jgi:hypothetical protein
MSTNTKKTYDAEFNKQAVQLLIGSGQSADQSFSWHVVQCLMQNNTIQIWRNLHQASRL